MPSKILVTSKSNLKLAKDNFPEHIIHLVKSPPDKVPERYKGEVYALGGGAVIDTAKMMAWDKPCIAIPTTACGAASTSWAVVWKKDKKISVPTKRPILDISYKAYNIKLPRKVIESTMVDCKCHIMDSLCSPLSNDQSEQYCRLAKKSLSHFKMNGKIWELIDAGNWAGSAIEITGTGFYHAMSYVLTLRFGLSHGEALKEVLLMKESRNWNEIIKQAKKYEKFKNRL